jgi:GNAT superfamily N-acetyltransferase
MRINEHFPIQEYKREDGFLVSTDPAKLDVAVIHDFLANESYWSPGIARRRVARMIDHALCYGVYAPAAEDEAQVGFARVISDFTSFAYLADVFILRPYRGRGLGHWLIECILAHPELGGLRKWTLDTQDAHWLYEQFGFAVNPKPETHMVFRPERPSSPDAADA